MIQRVGLFTGVGLLAGATIILEVALTRLYSVFFGHHLAFFAISLGLFGVGLGGVLLHLFPALARPPALLRRLSYLTGAASLATVLVVIFVMTAKPVEQLDGGTLLRMGKLYLVCSVPFTLVGVVIAGALKYAARDVSKLYLVDLLGAAAGGLLAIAALRFGAPRAFLVTSLLMAASCLAFALGSIRPKGPYSPEERPANASVVAAFVLGVSVLFLGDLGKDPWLDMPKLKHVDMKKVQFQKWSELAFVTVDRPTRGMAWMRFDGSSSTAILSEKTRPPRHPDEMAYVLHGGEGSVLVIGAGGGRDIRAALRAGHSEVYVAEINAVVVDDVMRGKFAKFSGHLYDKPGVHVEVVDGRSYVRSTSRQFRNIVVSLVDTASASSVGALALSENSLYTEEAFADFLRKLEPKGTLIVNRWDPEFERLLSLGVAGLRRLGVENPREHLFACSHARSTSLLIKRTPISVQEMRKLRNHCKRKRFAEVLAPDRSKDALHEMLLEGVVPDDPSRDLRAPTDDRPFFFYSVPSRGLPAALSDYGELAKNQQGLLTLVTSLVASAVVGLILLLLPLLVRPTTILRASDRGPRLRALAFFACIGVGFVLVEVGLVAQFVMFLGHPVYALSAVLCSLLVSSGLGSLWTSRVADRSAVGVGSRRAQVLVMLLVLMALGLGDVLRLLVELPLWGRVAITFALLAPLGLLMGTQAPLAIRLVSGRSEALVPWCWGLGGLASVIATASGTLLAMHAGFSSLLICAAVAYLFASLAMPPAASAPSESRVTS